MIKLKEILKSLRLMTEDDANVGEFIPANEGSNKSINDEFKVNHYMLEDVEKIVEKVNKKLKARNLPELTLNILNEEWIEYPANKKKPEGEKKKLLVFTIKIEGEVPEIKDYEFIAKIEHGQDGNIINMAPNRSVEKLPDSYKFSNQRCDICHTDRERFNTFIIRKVATDELICAGSTCLKKFMPLDVVKAMVDYAIQLNDVRDVIADAESRLFDYDDEYSGGRGGGRYHEVYQPKEILMYVLIAYLNNAKTYISRTKAQEWGKESTLSEGLSIKNALERPLRTEWDKKAYREAKAVYDKYKNEAEKWTEDVLTWARSFDFDKAAQENPSMDAYYHNLKILLGRNYLEGKHLGYFSSLISLYIRAKEIASEKEKAKPIEYFGNIGDKFVDRAVTLRFVTSIPTMYGEMNIFSFYDKEGYNFVYKGGNYLPVSKGDTVLLSGTVKKHEEYKGTKQTIIQRPKVKELENEQ